MNVLGPTNMLSAWGLRNSGTGIYGSEKVDITLASHCEFYYYIKNNANHLGEEELKVAHQQAEDTAFWWQGKIREMMHEIGEITRSLIEGAGL